MWSAKFMKRAYDLARRGKGKVSPNPTVGAIIVRAGKIIAEGWHRYFGGPHAEIEALRCARKKKKSAKDATMYVTLEPCVHFGKTPPCAPEIIKAGISRVIVGTKDLNPAVNGRGIKALKKAGIKVEIQNTPFVAMKVAMSLDGKIATCTGDSKWITSGVSRAYVRCLRDMYDAILIGSGTALKDNPNLAGKKTNPVRVVLDSKLKISPKAKLLRDKNVILITTSAAKNSKIKLLQKRGFHIKIFPKRILLRLLLRYLKKQNINSILVEGGSEIFGAFIDAKLVDKLYWFIAPRVIGGKKAVPAVSGKGIFKMANALKFTIAKLRFIDRDIFMELEPYRFPPNDKNE